MRSRETDRDLCAGIFFYSLIMVLLVLVPFAGSRVTTAQSLAAAPASIIYDNGPIATGAVSRSGTTAPAGTGWAESSYDFGSTTENNTTLGFGCQLIIPSTSNRCADDFNVPVGQMWTIDQVIVFAYQTNYTGTVSPMAAATLRIWNGRPGDAGSTIVFGDTTTNRLSSSTDALLYRIANSGPPSNTAPGTSRKLWQNNLSVSPAAVLTAGNYWIDFQIDAGTAGNFTPPVLVTGARALPAWNARQFGSTLTWVDLIDVGNPASAPDVPQDIPFRLEGSISGAPLAPRSRELDFNGDNRSDLAIARSTAVSSQTTWWTYDGTSANANAMPWGLGVGFSGGDIATPKDFDGDGKTDISVWRGNAGDGNRSYFYTLQSSNSTFVATQFGSPGDDPSIVGDYDGDGKADYAVFRANPTSGNDTCGGGAAWFYRPSSTPATDFVYVCWGALGDRPYPGDFDGDGKTDFVVVRNSGGYAIHYQKLSGGSTRGFQYGLFTDKFVSADFDADGRTDICAVRDNGAGNYIWYVLNSGNGQFLSVLWGSPATDFIVPGDYDGDNKSDYVVWRSGTGGDNGVFYELRSFSSPNSVKFGQSAASLAAPDYPVGAGINVH